MTECERAKFLASLGVDVAKLCDFCMAENRMSGESHQTCFALKEIKSHNDVFDQLVEKKAKVFPSIDDFSKTVNTKTFTFEVCTTMGHYAVVAPTYAEAMQLVRDETREPVRSCRKCSE